MSPYNPTIQHRQSIRLPGYDYGQTGAYFITICAHNHQCLFGDIANGTVRLSPYGQIILEEWQRTGVLRPYVKLDAFAIMPNHFHAILFITSNAAGWHGHTQDAPTGAVGGGHMQDAPTGAVGGGHMQDAPTGAAGVGHADSTTRVAAFGRPVPGALPAIVRGFKSAVSSRIKKCGVPSPTEVWQRNYYEHVVRDDDDLSRLREYVANNALHWELDQLHPDNASKG